MLNFILAGLVSGLVYSSLTAILWFGFALIFVVVQTRREIASAERKIIRRSLRRVRIDHAHENPQATHLGLESANHFNRYNFER